MSIEIFTPIVYPPFRLSPHILLGLTLENFEERAPQIEIAIKEVMAVFTAMSKEADARRATLVQGFMQVPACLTGKRLNPTTEKIVNSIAPRVFYVESDLWMQVASHLGVSGGSLHLIRYHVRHNLSIKDQVARKAKMALRAREVLLNGVGTNPHFRTLLIENDDKRLLEAAEEFLYAQYREENYPDGKEVYISSCCHHCSRWTVGEKHCSCGRTRVSLEYYGSFLGGDQIVYPNPY